MPLFSGKGGRSRSPLVKFGAYGDVPTQLVVDFTAKQFKFESSQYLLNCVWYTVRDFWGRVPNFKESEASKQCYLASDWLKFGTLLRKYRTLFGLNL